MGTGLKRAKTPDKAELLKKPRKKQSDTLPASSSSEPSGTIISEKEEKNSPFHLHLSRILTNDEMNQLEEKAWKFRSELPAIDMRMLKWVGTRDHILDEATSSDFSCIKHKLYQHFSDICKLSKQIQFFLLLFGSYQDILHCNKKPFFQGGTEDSCTMDAYVMHALNHIYRTRDLVIKNDAQLKKGEEEEEYLRGGSFLDQGFTRPKVMFLLPLRSIAFRVVKRMIELTPNNANVEHIGRFNEEFGNVGVEDEEGEDGSLKPEKPKKPADFQILFGGNSDDHFMVGIKFTKRSVKLYSDFYSSDIIVASPLAMVGKIAEAGEGKGKDVDYLSSIELLIIDHADVIAMQNWSHVDTVVAQLNHTPSKQHGTDIMRTRRWYLDGHSRYYRQTILLGSFLNPDMNALFNQFCVNYDGKVKSVREFKGVLPKILLQVWQVYERFDATSIGDEDDARLEYFSKKVFPKIKDSIEGGVMLFISSYFEFVRVRNFLKSQNASFCLLGEYTKQSDVSRARVWFFEGKRKIMLYTERAHFHHRYKIRGINKLIVYSLPERMEFYPEIINMFDGSTDMACHVMFSRFDCLKLQRIVGTVASKRMLSSDKGVFVFC